MSRTPMVRTSFETFAHGTQPEYAPVNTAGIPYVAQSPGADGKAAAFSRIVSAAGTTNATVAKASPGTLATVIGYNASTSARFLKFYNKATSPTVGTDTPVLTLRLPPATSFAFDLWAYMDAGISYALTTAAADNDTGALTAGDVVCLNVGYA